MKKIKNLINIKSYIWIYKFARNDLWLIVLNSILSAILSGLSVIVAIISKNMIDSAIKGDNNKTVIFVIVFAFIILGQIGLSSSVSYISSWLREKLKNGLQKNTMKDIFNKKWAVIGEYHSGDLLTRLTDDASKVVEICVNSFPLIVALVFQLIFAFATLFIYNKNLAIIAFLLGPVSIIFSWKFGKKLKKMQHKIQSSESKYRSFLNECIQNLLIVKSFNYEKASLNNIDDYQKNKFYWIKKKNILNIGSNIILSIGYRLGFFASFIFGAYSLARKTTTFGTFTAYLQLVGQIQAPMEGLSKTLTQLITSISSVERLIEIENLDFETDNKEIPLNGSIQVGINLRNITFWYKKEMLLIKNQSLVINPGETIAIVGHSGSGKTTMIRLLLSLLYPKSGNICLFQRNNNRFTLSENTRSYFSYVPQGNTLFSGSIAENLKVADYKASDCDLIEALKNACIWEYVEKSNNGLDTVIGEDGKSISEGQAQRISIARALLKQSPILLLDEATSALDIETERKVIQNIKRVKKNLTCIVVTHRISILDICNHVYRLENGKFIKVLNQVKNNA